MTLNELAKKTTDLFRLKFYHAPEFLFYAPGRVNLIGEHTDYNNGFVFPCAIDRGTFLAIKSRDDNTVNVIAANFENKSSSWKTDKPIAHDKAQPWSNYLRGVNDQFQKQGKQFRGMDILALGNVPRGAGLSSSASFEVAFATAINQINQFKFTATKIAKLCQAAENDFVGCKCGIMDQLISAAGQEHHALLIDCKTLAFHPIALPQKMAILVIDSKVKRGLVDSEYNTRREQCESAAARMGISSLREATLALLDKEKSNLDYNEFKRARHVISENQRTEKAALAFQTGNYALLSQLMSESHASMRDDFEITTAEIDYLVEIIHEVLQLRGGVRMTGGGFGGCVVALMPETLAQTVIDTVEKKYRAKTSLKAEIHRCVASAGAGKFT